MVYSVVLLHSSASSHRPSSRSARECVFLGGTTLAILSTNSHVYLLTAAQTYDSSSPLISIIQHQTVINTSSSRIEMHSERNRSKQFAKTFRTMGYYDMAKQSMSVAVICLVSFIQAYLLVNIFPYQAYMSVYLYNYEIPIWPSL